jgi:hypothetical protein
MIPPGVSGCWPQIILLRRAREARPESNFLRGLTVSMAGEPPMRIFSACIVMIVLGGCATVIRGTEQDVSVDTVPRGAMVEFSNGQSCTTPCSIAAKRNQPLEVHILMDGCVPQTAFIRPRLTATGGILGGLPDLATGAVYDLEPSSLSFNLLCAEANIE